MASPWEFSIHPCLLRGEISSISFSLPPHSAHPFFTVSSRQVNISWERRGKKEKKTKPPVSCPKRRKHTALSLQVLPNLTATAHLKDVRSPAGITKSAGDPEGSSRVRPGPRPPACPRPRPPSPSPARGGCLECGSGNLPRQLLTATCSATAAATTRRPPEFPRQQAGLANKARPQGGLFCQRSLQGREIKGLLTHQTRGLRSLNGLQ